MNTSTGLMNSFYTPVPQQGSQDGFEIDEKDDFRSQATRSSHPPHRNAVPIVLSMLFVASMSANAILFWRQFVRPWDLINELPTRYAHLRRNVPTLINTASDFDSTNRTIHEAAWASHDLKAESFFVALDEGYTKQVGLPHSQRWPWDLSKGVYIPIAAHELHCVQVLRTSINEYEDDVSDVERTWHYPHLLHCLNVLRESVMCNADDSPMYIGRLHDNVHISHPRAGTGMTRMCRNWDQWKAWTRARSACYSPVHWGEEGFNEVDRYKYCPDGARPWDGMPSDP